MERLPLGDSPRVRIAVKFSLRATVPPTTKPMAVPPLRVVAPAEPAEPPEPSEPASPAEEPPELVEPPEAGLPPSPSSPAGSLRRAP